MQTDFPSSLFVCLQLWVQGERFEEAKMDPVSWSLGLDESLRYSLPTDSLSLPFSKHSLDALSQSYNQAFDYQCG